MYRFCIKMYHKFLSTLKMRNSLLRKILFITLLMFVVCIIFMRPSGQVKHNYDYISKDDILESLHEELAINFTSSAVSSCDYYENINDESSLSPSLVDADLPEGHRIKDGGEYAPVECRPTYSIAIVVPYRDRAEHLRGFLIYMHIFLRLQRIHYRIFVVEQVDSKPFNRAKLINIGAAAAMKAGYPCLIFHDVDLLPLRPANLYACTKMPRHMSSNIHKFSFILPYMTLFGGVVGLISKQFKLVNGMSNEFSGFGGEDDDLYIRLDSAHLKVCRFEAFLSKYHVLLHEKLEPNNYDWERTKKRLLEAKEKIKADGLSSLKFTEVATALHPLFTHIMVDL